MGARDAAFPGMVPFHHVCPVASWTALTTGARSDVRPMLQRMSPVVALFGHGAMSDLSPLCAAKLTLIVGF
jgi:hypothetical protein